MKIAIALALAAAAYGQQHWKYVPGEAATIISMEWRRVLDSPLRQLFRQEIPQAGAPLLGGINFIEGIERVVIASGSESDLVVLNGKFDLERLRSMAVSDGGIAIPYKDAVFLAASESGDDVAEMALVNEAVVLLGDRQALMDAVDRQAVKRPLPKVTADLWIMELKPGHGIERFDMSLHLKDGIYLDSRFITSTEPVAERIAVNARGLDIQPVQNGREVRLSKTFTAAEFGKRAGQWRSTLAQLPSKAVASSETERPRGPMKVRIYGLESGTKEIILTPSK